ncbi:MAG: NINE protein [Ruminococcus sp.]|nr:NINE protein [Ruminococcus sp.]
MYCRNCGSTVDTGSPVCTNCAVPVGQGTRYCPNCGAETLADSNACMQCGFVLNANAVRPPVGAQGAKSKIAAGLLGIFLGAFGVHNFYLGYNQKAVAQLVATIIGIVLSCIGIGALIVFAIEVWGIVEGIFILTGKINTDASGNPLID